MSIGVLEFEKQKKQPVIVNVEAFIDSSPDWKEDALENTVSYAPIVEMIRTMGQDSHIELVETCAELVAEFCLRDCRVRKVTVRIEKPQIYEFAQSVGVEISRSRN